MEKYISLNELARFRDSFGNDKYQKYLMNTVAVRGLTDSMRNFSHYKNISWDFSLKLNEGKVTDQKSTGRCWIYAALNCLRYDVIHEYGLKDFQLSQNYLAFYDLLEKSNFFLESILEHIDEPLNDRLLSHMMQCPVQDAGQWDMFCNIIEKYGLVPYDVMPDTPVAESTAELISYLSDRLREFACFLRKNYSGPKSVSKLRNQKEEMLISVFELLGVCLGLPPNRFSHSMEDKQGKVVSFQDISPLEFYKKIIKYSLRSQNTNIINYPSENMEYYQVYSVKHLGNVYEGRKIQYLNLSLEIIKNAAIKQLKNGRPVWFGCDSRKFADKEKGIFDINLFDFSVLMDSRYELSKAENLLYGNSFLTHAMVFMGVHIDNNGKSVRWYVENSHGDRVGHNGYFVMSDEWFDKYVYQIVIDREYIDEKAWNAYLSEPVMLEPWDALGMLAK